MRAILQICAAAVFVAWTLSGAGAFAATAGEEAAWEADKAFVSALAQHDSKRARRLVRADFSGITADGERVSKRKAIAALDTLATDAKEESDVQRHFYGRLATVRGSHNGLRFLRVWAEKNGNWRLFAMIDTPVVPAERASVEAQSGAGDCDNPCRTVPYKPYTGVDKAILAAWQETKMIEWKPNAAAWAQRIADEFMIINNTTIRTKPEREAIAKRQEASGQGTPGDPIISMEIQDFGDNAAVMFSKHFPVRGGKPYNNIRIWVLRDARWQLAISQQSQIKSATAMPAVASK